MARDSKTRHTFFGHLEQLGCTNWIGSICVISHKAAKASATTFAVKAHLHW